MVGKSGCNLLRNKNFIKLYDFLSLNSICVIYFPMTELFYIVYNNKIKSLFHHAKIFFLYRIIGIFFSNLYNINIILLLK